jgi:hypothetical protein
MAGEYSKRIGEIGENTVGDFLELVGWVSPQKNFDIQCSLSHKHLGDTGKPRRSHGIDAYFHYESPMITGTIDNIIISSKFKAENYPNNVLTQFKEYYYALAETIECFKKSQLRNEIISHHTYSKCYDKGVIFWLNNKDTTLDLTAQLNKTNFELVDDYYHDGIYLVDNFKLIFISESIKYVKNKYTDAKIEFAYFSTGYNNDDNTMKSGNFMPVSYINSGIIPFKITTKSEDVIFLLSTSENFQRENLLKLMGLSKNIGLSFQKYTEICFPNYNILEHENIVQSTKQIFQDTQFVKNLTVSNFNNPTIK